MGTTMELSWKSYLPACRPYFLLSLALFGVTCAGPDCSFVDGLCDWSDVGPDDLPWRTARDLDSSASAVTSSFAYVNVIYNTTGSAKLQSPVIITALTDRVRLVFQYRLSAPRRREQNNSLTVKLSNDGNDFHVVWRGSHTSDAWVGASVMLTEGGTRNLKVRFEVDVVFDPPEGTLFAHIKDVDVQIMHDLCAAGPCLHGGLCFSNDVTYTCICTRGYMGERCQILPGSNLLILKHLQRELLSKAASTIGTPEGKPEGAVSSANPSTSLSTTSPCVSRTTSSPTPGVTTRGSSTEKLITYDIATQRTTVLVSQHFPSTSPTLTTSTPSEDSTLSSQSSGVTTIDQSQTYGSVTSNGDSTVSGTPTSSVENGTTIMVTVASTTALETTVPSETGNNADILLPTSPSKTLSGIPGFPTISTHTEELPTSIFTIPSNEESSISTEKTQTFPINNITTSIEYETTMKTFASSSSSSTHINTVSHEPTNSNDRGHSTTHGPMTDFSSLTSPDQTMSSRTTRLSPSSPISTVLSTIAGYTVSLAQSRSDTVSSQAPTYGELTDSLSTQSNPQEISTTTAPIRVDVPTTPQQLETESISTEFVSSTSLDTSTSLMTDRFNSTQGPTENLSTFIGKTVSMTPFVTSDFSPNGNTTDSLSTLSDPQEISTTKTSTDIAASTTSPTSETENMTTDFGTTVENAAHTSDGIPRTTSSEVQPSTYRMQTAVSRDTITTEWLTGDIGHSTEAFSTQSSASETIATTRLPVESTQTPETSNPPQTSESPSETVLTEGVTGDITAVITTSNLFSTSLTTSPVLSSQSNEIPQTSKLPFETHTSREPFNTNTMITSSSTNLAVSTSSSGGKLTTITTTSPVSDASDAASTVIITTSHLPSLSNDSLVTSNSSSPSQSDAGANVALTVGLSVTGAVGVIAAAGGITYVLVRRSRRLSRYALDEI